MSKSASPSAQINALEKQTGYNQIDSDIHKADARQAVIDSGITDRHEVAKRIGIFESGTMKDYHSTYRQYLKFDRDHEGHPMNLRDATPERIAAFLEYKWDDGDGVAPSTLRGYCEAFTKLEGMLETLAEQKGEKWEHTEEWDNVLKEYRAEANDAEALREHEPRAYNDPQAVIDAIQDPRAQIAASLQYETGLRVHDVTYIRLNEDGTLNINSKAGYRVPNFPIPAHLSEALRAIAGKDGFVKFNLIGYDRYRGELMAAAEKCGERWSGTHSLRHSYAQESYAAHRAEGMTDYEARAALAEELFHGRIWVTYFYVPKE